MGQKKINIKHSFFIILSLVLIVESNPTFKQNTTIRYGLILADLSFVLLFFMHNKRVKINPYAIWAIIVLAFTRISALWSVSPRATIQSCKNFLIVLLICSMISLMVENKNDFQLFWRSLLVAYLFNAAYIMSIVGFGNIGEYRIGVDYEGLGLWNANSIGAFTGFGCVMLLFMFQNERKRLRKAVYAVLAIFMLFVVLNTGSRKALVVVSGVYILYMFLLDTGNKRMRNVLIIFILGLILWTVILSNETLYNLIGSRMIRMFQELTGHKTSENSMNMRMLMISYGLGYFIERPFWGYGLASYSSLSVFHTYAHNNYIELLVGIGLVGIIVYYFIYVLYIKKGIGLALKSVRDPIAVFCFSMSAVVIVNHMALVAYDDIVYNCMFLLLVTYVEVKKHEMRNVN